MQEKWSSVDQYFGDMLILSDSTLEQTLTANLEAGLPAYDVSANQGQLLQIFAQMVKAKSILEIGTLGGYSTIWLARALPSDGRLVTLENEPRHAEVAQANIARAGLSQIVDVRVGNALDLLPKLHNEGIGPFDLIFIDADKKSNPDYFSWALRLARTGSVIIVDNVVRNGEVVNSQSDDPSVQGVRQLNKLIKSEPRVHATVVQTVGAKGYDGFIIARVNE